jgi:tRNA pseudouridine38-40 synthase
MTAENRNIKMLIAYDGTHYSGWQKQKNDKTIQGEIEYRLKRMTREEISLHGAGRTDAGVHADGMCAHFLTHSTLSVSDLQRGLNAMLPGAIRIFSVEETDLDFHARFKAKGKLYHYSLYCGKIHPPQSRLYQLHVPLPLDLNTIHSSLVILEGTHDFSSFENSGSRDKTICSGRGAVRTIHSAKLITGIANTLVFQFAGDGFLRNMIRNLVGTLIEVGQGKLTSKEFGTILNARDRSLAGRTAPPHGLCLKEVFY